MNKNSLKDAPFVVLDDDGFMQLYTHNGCIVNNNMLLRVNDSPQDFAFVIGKFACNIVGTKQEMLDYIKENDGKGTE